MFAKFSLLPWIGRRGGYDFETASKPECTVEIIILGLTPKRKHSEVISGSPCFWVPRQASSDVIASQISLLPFPLIADYYHPVHPTPQQSSCHQH